MFAKFSRGWSMTKGSFKVLRQHPKLAIFPALSGAVFLLIAAAILVPLWQQLGTQGVESFFNWLGDNHARGFQFYATLLGAGFVLSAIAIFFNVALIHCVLRCHAGQEPSIRGGFTAAVGLLPQIIGWAFFAATVGVLLNMIQNTLKEYLGFLGSLLGGLLEFSWAVVTYFVMPVLAAEKVGPVTAVKRSAAILRSKWGESVVGEATFGLVGGLLMMLAMTIFFVGLAITLMAGTTGIGVLGPVFMVLGGAALIVTMVVLQTLSTIFQSGVYVYATTGQVPATLDPAMVQAAFRPKT